MSQLYETFPRDDLTDEMIADAARLFTENYGVWGGDSRLRGKRVTLTAKRLREEYLPEDGECRYTRVTSDGKLVGNAFTSRWNWNGKRVCWVTQLVVHRDHRGKGIASILLKMSMVESDDVYGIMSSHPYACMAAATMFGTSIENVSLDFIREHSDVILKASPIQYVKEAAVSGTLFDANDSTGLISGVNTKFLVDHEEPLDALRQVRSSRRWPLGGLAEGYEYLLVVPAKLRRSKASLASK
ncbi:hypothetical protein QQX98_008902 [Neonectria punicea]|uniref:N-acetyltransferase domain-containing protein n=1 Tax=Neonectria punicea TaxID=979145 RepID=A0ABR1GTT2_9HYPO